MNRIVVQSLFHFGSIFKTKMIHVWTHHRALHKKYELDTTKVQLKNKKQSWIYLCT